MHIDLYKKKERTFSYKLYTKIETDYKYTQNILTQGSVFAILKNMKLFLKSFEVQRLVIINKFFIMMNKLISLSLSLVNHFLIIASY